MERLFLQTMEMTRVLSIRNLSYYLRSKLGRGDFKVWNGILGTKTNPILFKHQIYLVQDGLQTLVIIESNTDGIRGAISKVKCLSWLREIVLRSVVWLCLTSEPRRHWTHAFAVQHEQYYCYDQYRAYDYRRYHPARGNNVDLGARFQTPRFTAVKASSAHSNISLV